MEYSLFFILGLVIGALAFRHIVVRKIEHIINGLERGTLVARKIEKPVRPDVVYVKFWRKDDMIYAYNSDTEEFLAQGLTKQDIIDKLDKYWPETNFKAKLNDLKEHNIE